MNKSISIEVRTTPDDPITYGDRITVLLGNDLLFHDACSTSPNPFQPSTHKPWRAVYAWIALGKYTWRCIDSPKHGKCLALGTTPTRFPNPNHDNVSIAYDIEIHEGYSEEWRGSSGCITVPPHLWERFIALFDKSVTGELAILSMNPREVLT